MDVLFVHKLHNFKGQTPDTSAKVINQCKLSLTEVIREPNYAYATITTKTDFVVSMHAQYYRLNSLNALGEQATRFGALRPSLFVYGPKSSKSTINRGRAKFSIGCY